MSNLEQIEELIKGRRRQLKDQLPTYAFFYEEGERFMRSEHHIRIEEQIKDYKIKLMEDLIHNLTKKNT